MTSRTRDSESKRMKRRTDPLAQQARIRAEHEVRKARINAETTFDEWLRLRAPIIRLRDWHLPGIDDQPGVECSIVPAEH